MSISKAKGKRRNSCSLASCLAVQIINLQLGQGNSDKYDCLNLVITNLNHRASVK